MTPSRVARENLVYCLCPSNFWWKRKPPLAIPKKTNYRAFTSVESIIALCCLFFQQSIGFNTSTRRSSWVLLMVLISTFDVAKIPILVSSNKMESIARHSFRKNKRKPPRACCHWIWVLVTCCCCCFLYSITSDSGDGSNVFRDSPWPSCFRHPSGCPNVSVR